jgi:chromosome segregation ATPase
MELEEIVSRLEHLDGERRKEKTALGNIDRRVAVIEGSISAIHSDVKEISNQVSQLQAMADRFAQIDSSLNNIRKDLNRSIEKVEKQRLEREKDMEKVRIADVESINKALTEYKKNIATLKDIKKDLKDRVDEEFRLSRSIEEMQASISETLHQNDEFQQHLKIIEETQRSDAKRITDIQGEATSVRKRSEEQRGKLEFLAESVQKLDTRFSDNLANESDRKQFLLSLVERENLQQVERDHTWKEWQTRFEMIDQDAKKFDTKIMGLDITLKELKKSQATFDEINQRFDRKINELIEMQRLTDERFRQEWMSFKAEDQKRWTNYSLSQEEMMHDANHEVENTTDRISKLEDITQEIRDVMNILGDDTQKRLQKLLDLTNDWIDSNQRTLGQGK